MCKKQLHSVSSKVFLFSQQDVPGKASHREETEVVQFVRLTVRQLRSLSLLPPFTSLQMGFSSHGTSSHLSADTPAARRPAAEEGGTGI
ncbi:Hypothetical protein SMAX5B_018882 [Scophthalmus maximus]|uniref:Uncharacterized protein n=1 Tax=Scophthalmus maximus TaxID=52904 RepID=A0A2U9B797_SCOMX|nr:Hypothetical protein SMAX5B_018882 [Scophthalmus maximus]